MVNEGRLVGEVVDLQSLEGEVQKSEGMTGVSAVLLEDLLTSLTVGGVESGTNYDKGTLLEKIFRDMLDPVLFPILTPPSVSVVSAGPTLLEIGTSKADVLTATFDRGSIDPAYGTSGYRSGEVGDYSLNGGAAQSTGVFNVMVDALHKNFSVTASYAEGEQPKDSVGNDYGEPLPAGNVTSPMLTYEFVEALWANTANPLVIAKLPLVSKSENMLVMEFPPCSSENPETFDIPTSWNVTAVEVRNDLTNMFDDCLIEFTTSDVEHSDMAGNSVAYTRYECNLGYDMGSRIIRVKWL